MNVVIGIDPGTACGWAVLDMATGDRVASGTWDLSARRHEGGGMRFVRARRLVDELLLSYNKVVLVYEEVRRHAGTDAAHVYGGLIATFAATCEEQTVPYTGIPVGTVKKTATGKGNAPKGLMVEAARERWGHPLRLADDNEADALWIAETWRRAGALPKAS